MDTEKKPLFYYHVYGISSFILIGICIAEYNKKGAIISFFLFTIILLLGIRKKRNIRKKEIMVKTP